MRLRHVGPRGEVVAAVLAAMLALGSSDGRAAGEPAPPAKPTPPTSYVYRDVEGQALRAFVFRPSKEEPRATHAILLFHGGGWVAGAPDWTFTAARRFADAGLVAIAVQYRLAGETVTPIDALQDVCAAFTWARRESSRRGCSGRGAGDGGWAGGHLVASSATVGCPGDTSAPRAGPDALLLWSPALDVGHDRWFQLILLGRAEVKDYSPVEHVRASTPPTSIVHGEKDTLTPLAGSQRYCDRLKSLGGTCKLNVYPGVGHLLTRNLANQEDDFDPDPAAVADGVARHLAFLVELGMIPSR